MSDGCYYGATLVGMSRMFAPQTKTQSLQKNEAEKWEWDVWLEMGKEDLLHVDDIKNKLRS